MEAYLDNTATTRVSEPVIELMVKVMREDYGNPSAMHLKGVQAERYIKDAKKQIAKCLKAKENEIIFTSGGTEANNMALLGGARANARKGRHIITTAIEHASVSATMRHLEEEGYEITYLPVTKDGVIRLEDLKAAIRPDTSIVSVMYVNNEIGSVMPVEEIGAMIKETDPQILFHVDAIQAFGKYVIHPKKLQIDLLSVSGHKLHAPKGVGFLYVREKTKVQPILFGGGQQGGMRSGTENVPGIAAMGLAAEMAYEDLDAKIDHLYALKDHFMENVSQIEGVTINSLAGRAGAPQIVSVSFEGIRSEVLLHALEDRGVYASAGSACSTNKPSVSATLKGIGVAQSLLDATLRFSFCYDTTTEELDYAVAQLKELLPMLRRYSRH
jgi:cysteine desulfurase